MLLENVGKLDEDLLLSDEMFDEILDSDNEVEIERKALSVRDRAMQLRLTKKFDAIWSARKKQHKAELKKVNEKDARCYVSDFGNGQPTLRTGMWQSDMNGIRTWSDKGIVWACNHPIYIKTLLRNAETGKCKVELMYFTRGQWRKAIVDRKMISSANSIIGLSDNGINATSDNARALVKYLSDLEAYNEDDIPEQRSSGKLGWLDGIFLPYDNSVVFDNEENLKSLVDSIKEVGSRKIWFDTVKELRQRNRIEILIYIAASLGSVLVEPCGALPFIVDLWGDTGKGKTVSLMLATSIWGDPNEGGYATDAKATVTAMEIRLNALNSLPMMIDDMAQIKNQDDDFSGLVYKWCAGRGRDRSNTSLGLNKQTSWQNCILTNAERSLVTETMQAGAVNRIIDVEMSEIPIFGDDGNEVANILRKNYGFAGREWIQSLQLIGDEAIRSVQKRYLEELKAHSKETERKEEKQLIPMSILMAADELSERLLFKDGVRLDFEQCFNLLKGLGEVSEHKRAYEFIMGTIASNENLHFNYNEERATVIWGQIKDGYVYIVAPVFTEMMKKEGFQDKAFLSWANKNGLLLTQGDGRLKKKVRVDGITNPTWCVVLKMEENDEKYENADFVRVSDDVKLPFE